MKYDSWKFKKIAETKLGKELWKFLNESDNIIRMETASDLKKPAARAISKWLLLRFNDEVRELRIKQMIGHMIKQIMIDNGYEVDQKNVLVDDGLFFKASRYKIKSNVFILSEFYLNKKEKGEEK